MPQALIFSTFPEPGHPHVIYNPLPPPSPRPTPAPLTLPHALPLPHTLTEGDKEAEREHH